MSRLRIATFNVNGIRSRLPHLLQWLQREQPDVACLQELKAADEGFPRAQIEAAGYGARWQGQQSWNGVAILARGTTPIESRRGLPGDPDDTHSRYLEAVAHGVVVGCIYLPNGNPQPGPKFDYKLRWFERLIAHARTLHASGHPVVLAGDFNVVPTDELDIYNPRSWRRDALLQPASRDAWRRLLEQGWTDALRTLHPQEKIFTFWDYFREHWPRNAGLRIDHLLLSPALAPRLQAAGVDRWVRGLEGASDHAPTWVDLAMGARSGSTRRSRSPAAGAKDAGTGGTRQQRAPRASNGPKATGRKAANRPVKQPVSKLAEKAPKKGVKSVAKKVAKTVTKNAAKTVAKKAAGKAAQPAASKKASKAARPKTSAATPAMTAAARAGKAAQTRRAKRPG